MGHLVDVPSWPQIVRHKVPLSCRRGKVGLREVGGVRPVEAEGVGGEDEVGEEDPDVPVVVSRRIREQAGGAPNQQKIRRSSLRVNT